MPIRRLPAATKFPSLGAALSIKFPYGRYLEYDDHAGKRRRSRAVAEAQTPAYKPDFTGPAVDELVEITGVGPGGNEQYDRRSGLAGLAPAFEYPIINRPSVRRVAENRFSGPVLLQPVVRYGVELSALGIPDRGARIEGEMEFCIEGVEEACGGAQSILTDENRAGFSRFISLQQFCV